MLTFLNSAILFGLAAVSIPILIHLFSRQKTRVILFSSLKFLKELQQQQIRKLKIRQILLLILRSLLVLALVLSFARPTLKTSTASSLETGAQLTAVIILDNTMSMGQMSEGRPLLSEAKNLALQVLSTLRQGDEIYLLYPHAPVQFAYEGPRYSIASVEEIIGATEISYASTDFSSALTAAAEIMQKSNNINKEVYLISDLQLSGLKVAKGHNGSSLLPDDVKFFVLPVISAEDENLSIADVSFGNQILEKDKVVEVSVKVRNTSDRDLSNKLVHLFVNGKRVAQDVVDIPRESAVNVLFRLVPDQSGFQSGYVLLEDDLLPQDNRRYFAFHIADKIPVLLIGNNEDDTYFLKLALRPQEEIASYIDITEIELANFDATDLSKFKVILLSNVSKFTSSQASRLQAFVRSGGGLMIFLGENVDLRNYNEYLHKKLNLPSLTRVLNESRTDQFLSLGKIDFSHPIFLGVFEEERFLESPHFQVAVDIDGSKQIDRIIEYKNGMPFLFESQLPNGKILYATTSLSRKWSDLTLKGFFVPLVNRSVFYLAGAASGENVQVYVGDELSFQFEENAAESDLSIEKPDGNRIKIKPEITKGSLSVRFQETDLPGIYQLFNKEQLMTQWACNYYPTEPETKQLDLDILQQYSHSGEIIEIREGENIEESLQQSRFGKEFWKFFVALALLIILVETGLSRQKTQLES